MEIDYALLLGLISVAIAIYLGLRGFSKGISSKLTRIETNTQPIGKTNESIVRIDERLSFVLRLLPLKGTVEGTLKNIGKVKVSANPGAEETIYDIETEKPVLNAGFIVKKGKETDLAQKEKELFGGKEPNIMSFSPNRIRMMIPCTDAKICIEYISFLLKWLDTTYWDALKEVNEFENITFQN